jgi:pimeloyl-ACP methyl ester carboxylesterase
VNLNATKFDIGNARACGTASAVAYQDAPTVRCDRTDTQAVVIELPDCRIVAFRGTSNLRDFITDAEFWRETLVVEADGADCQVHRGFLAAYESIIEELAAHLRGQPQLPLFITGHSLGGALAILAALELQRQKFPIVQVYTFGQPRVGNGAFKRLYEWSLGAQTFRVVFEEDCIARIPHLPHFTDPYRHAATEVLISSVTRQAVIAPTVAALLWSDAWGLWRAYRAGNVPALLDDALADHHVNNYVNAFLPKDNL